MAFGYYLLLYWHLIVLVACLTLLSGIVCFMFKRIHLLVIAGVAGAVGYIYSIVIDATSLSLLLVIVCIVPSLAVATIVKYILFLNKKAEQIDSI